MITREYLIYKHTNLINGKAYIGQTCQKTRIRWNYGLGYKHNAHFYAAIKKYGWNNFKHEILYEHLTQEEANKLEQELIIKYDLQNPDKGYNYAVGGATNIRYKTREEAAIAHKRIQHTAYLKMVANEEYAQKMRDKSLKTYYENKDNLEYKKLRASYNKKVRTKVNELRQELRKLYNQDKNLFLQEEYQLAFGFKEHKNYLCNSPKKLKQLLDIIKQRIINEKKPH